VRNLVNGGFTKKVHNLLKKSWLKKVLKKRLKEKFKRYSWRKAFKRYG
jgi:hypothetical protein